MEVLERLKSLHFSTKIILIIIFLIIILTFTLSFKSKKFYYRNMDENLELNPESHKSYFLQINTPFRLLQPLIFSYSYIRIGKFYQWEKDENNKDYLGSILGIRCNGINCFYHRCYGFSIHQEKVYGYTFYDGNKYGYEICYGLNIGKMTDIRL